MKYTKQFNIQQPNTQYKLKIKYDGYTSNTIIINSRTVFYVKTDGDDISTDTNAGKTWGTAFKTISTALNAAKTITPSATNLVEIWVAAGDYNIYTAMEMIKFVSIYGSFAGREITKEQRTYLTDNTKLKPTTNIINKGTSTDNSRHFKTALNAATAITPDSVTIDGICFKDALASSIYNEYSSPTFSNCVWHNNSGAKSAGAVYNKYSSPKFYNCQFINNRAGTTGGAIMYDTDITNDITKSIIDNCIFYNNSSKQNGSAIYANAHNKIKITNSIIDANKTTNNKYGGSVYINDKVTVEISNSYIIYNNDTLDATYCGTGVRLKGSVKSNSATLVANRVTFYKNISLTGTDYDIGRDVYKPTGTDNTQPTTVTNRPTIQLTNCKLVGGNIISTYSYWFNTNVGASSWTVDNGFSSNINASDINNINANRATTKIDSSYL